MMMQVIKTDSRWDREVDEKCGVVSVRQERGTSRTRHASQPHSDFALLVMSQPMRPHRSLRELAVLHSHAALTFAALTITSLRCLLSCSLACRLSRLHHYYLMPTLLLPVSQDFARLHTWSGVTVRTNMRLSPLQAREARQGCILTCSRANTH
jgi:hypothetical protein